MKRRLRSELQMSKPFATLEEELVVEIQRTAQCAIRWVTEALKPSGLTPAQFNVLRILRGARPGSLSGSEIANRMIADDPDLTRLLDRLEAAGLIEKERDTRDRRVVNVRITADGLERVEAASVAVRKRLESEWGGLGAKKKESLADLLEAARGVTD
jgi:DNA-binding MarR family transcriptional regulator